MASEIRVDKINSLSGVGTVTLSPTGVDIAGITTAATLKVGTGVTASSDGDIFATGVCTASSFSGPVTELTLTNQSSDTECFPIFSQAATSNQLPHTNTSLKFNSSTGALTSTSFVGGLPITSGADNRIITASSSSAIQGESGLTYDGTTLSNDAVTRNIQAGYNYVLIGSSDANGVSIAFDGDSNGDGAGTDYAFIEHNTSGDLNIVGDNPANASNIRFKTNSTTERVRIDSSGNVKIGDQAAASGALRYLDVQNSDASSASSGAILRLISSNQAQNSTTSVDLAKYRDGAFYINNNETHSGATTVFNIGGSEIARFTTGGLAIGGTGSDNTLDDYEEGTFTPSYDAGGGVTFSHSVQQGWYTKIGDTVTFTLYLQAYASTITGGNENNGVALQGLPFTIKNNNRYYPAFTIGRTYKFDINSDQRIYSYGDYNSANARFIMETDDSIGNLLVANQLNQNTTEMFLSGTYKV